MCDFLYKINFAFTVGMNDGMRPLISIQTSMYLFPVMRSCIDSIMDVRMIGDPFNEVGEKQVCGANVLNGYYTKEKQLHCFYDVDGCAR
jgi:hypothetical protein